MVELHSTSPLANNQSIENSTVYEPHNYNCDHFDEEFNELLSRTDLEDFLQSSSLDSYQFWELLSQQIESTECENELSDFVNHVADKETQFHQNKVPYFIKNL